MTISNLTKIAERSQNCKKTLGEKAKLLITSNFSVSHMVFKRLAQQTHGNKGLVWKRVQTPRLSGKGYADKEVNIPIFCILLQYSDSFLLHNLMVSASEMLFSNFVCLLALLFSEKTIQYCPGSFVLVVILWCPCLHCHTKT